MMASAWDLLRGDYSTWPDRPFYREVIARHGQPALDVGCGTGRLVLDYVASGLDVDGVDNSPEMLDICRAKAPRPRRRARRSTSSRCSRSTCPAATARSSCLPARSCCSPTRPTPPKRCAASTQHLHPGGVLVMPFMLLWPGRRTPIDGEWSPWYIAGERARPEDGATVRRHQRSRYHLDASAPGHRGPLRTDRRRRDHPHRGPRPHARRPLVHPRAVTGRLRSGRLHRTSTPSASSPSSRRPTTTASGPSSVPVPSSGP